MEFINVKLSDIGEVVGGSTPSTKNPDNYDGNIAWITPKDLAGYSKVYISRGERNITEAGFKSCSTKMLPKNSVLFSSRAPIGYVAISENDLCTNQGFKSIIPNEKVDYKFLYYLLKHNKDYIASKGSGSTFKEVSGSVMKGIDLSIPKDIDEQRKISKLLFDIDKKIELNNEINNNLYNEMQILYDEWFKSYNHFKNEEFKETILGRIPSKFNISDIYSISNVIYGAPFKSKMFNEEQNGKPIIRIRDLKDQNMKTYTPEVHPKGYLLQKGDITVGMDGEFRPYFWGNDEAWLNQRVCVFDNKRKNGKAFLYYTLKPLLDFIEKTEVATTVIHIGKNDFDEFKIVLPDNETLDRFDEITNPMVWQIVQNMIQNHKLEQLRDTLLPKLMNGEIDLDNIEI